MSGLRRPALVALVAGTAALGACDEPAEGAEGIDRQTFVATYADLRRAVVADSLDDAVRDSILAARGVTEADLRDYVDRRATDPDALSKTWREVLDTIAARDSAVESPIENVTPERP